MNNAQLINQTSGDVEYYTPTEIIEAARTAMGCISLDPASSLKANQVVKAEAIFTETDDAMTREWLGNIWMNHPFGRREMACGPGCVKPGCRTRGWHRKTNAYGNAAWVNKLIEQFVKGNVEQACCITFACTSEAWFQPLLQLPQCFLCPRTNYYLPDGSVLKGVTKGSVVTYLGPNVPSFADCFQKLGIVKVHMRPSRLLV